MFSEQSLESVSRTALENAEGRAIRFLRTSSRIARIAQELAAAGYTKKVRDEGFRLYFAVVGYSHVETATTSDSASDDAFNALERWEVNGFARVRAALHHKHPDAEKFVFANLLAAKGAAAVGAMATLLNRLDDLEHSPERKATRKEDKAALATLEERGITRAVRKELRKQLALATVDAEAPQVEVVPDTAIEHRQKQIALYEWIQDWADTARAVVTNRADLIRLGVAKPRKKKASAGAPPVPVPVAAPIGAPIAATQPQIEEHGPASRAA